jgi:hypothetical protein
MEVGLVRWNGQHGVLHLRLVAGEKRKGLAPSGWRLPVRIRVWMRLLL